jgi:small subunit ribosomal protein S17
MPKRILEGVVCSNAANMTVSVVVVRSVKHPLYKKTIRKSKKYAAHDPSNICKVGEKVRIIESRPISKTKKWLVVYENISKE